MPQAPNLDRVSDILEKVRELAISYYKETGKPLGVTGEMAEFEAARILGLQLCGARNDGYDAVRVNGVPKHIQIKGRRIMDNSKPGQRMGSIKLEKGWDSVMLVLLDESYRAVEIHEALRPAVKDALTKPGSKARNERGALGVSKFKFIGNCVWRRDSPRSTVSPKSGNLRQSGLDFLSQAISNSDSLPEKIGVTAGKISQKPYTNHVIVSRLYPSNESWTGRPSWWHEIPIEKIATKTWDHIILLCEKHGGNGFHILLIPKSWMHEHREKLFQSGGKYRLFLSAHDDDIFVEKRSKNNLRFGQWELDS